MPLYDTICSNCANLDQNIISLSDIENDESATCEIKGVPIPVFTKWRSDCLECGVENVVFRLQVPLKAPSLHVDARNYDAQMSKMHRSLDQRFVKSGEMDQVRHEHGKAFDDSLLAGSTKRIRDAGYNK